MPRIAITAVVLALLAAITWRYPLFHVVPLGQSVGENRSAAFDAEKVAVEFWAERLTPALATAADAAEVLAALDKNADAARKDYGRTVGLSRSSYFFLRGVGAVVAVEESRLGVSLGNKDDAGPGGDQPKPDLWLATGPVFGNAVRDATGLLESKEFPNSQHFNELAAALNALVESRVLPALREPVKVGQTIRFVACVEVPGGKVTQPLQVIPIHANLD